MKIRETHAPLSIPTQDAPERVGIAFTLPNCRAAAKTETRLTPHRRPGEKESLLWLL